MELLAFGDTGWGDELFRATLMTIAVSITAMLIGFSFAAIFTPLKLSKFKSLLSGFPAGTVSGAPKIRAMEIIDKLESSKRKVYAGGIGYFSSNGEFDTCIALRTAVAKKNKFYVQAGAGIVADSKPINEYNETINKAKAVINALK